MKVTVVPCRQDNYQYIVTDPTSGVSAAIDAYDPDKLEAAAKKEGVKLGKLLLSTHHHNDHSGGNLEFLKRFPEAQSYAGSEKSPGTQTILKHMDKFKIGNLDVTAIATPCHTQDHICYFVEDKQANKRAVFTGDTLFVSGCGRFFEGTGQEMHVALNERLASLPDDTVTYVGHEYTRSNVAFSRHIEPSNAAMSKLADFARDNECTTGKFTIADEKQHNVFMRVNHDNVRDHLAQLKRDVSSPVSVMEALRELKNNFKG